MHSHAQNVAQCIPNPLRVVGIKPKTYAPRPVRKDSTAAEVRFQPMSDEDRMWIWLCALDFERQTHRKGRHGGALGHMAIKVLHTLLFVFLNPTTGQLDPSYVGIRKAATICNDAVAEGLKQLKHFGILECQPRHDLVMHNGRPMPKWKANAYFLQLPSKWLDYCEPPRAPRPEPGTWGDHPPLPSVMEQAEIARKDGFTLKQVTQILRLSDNKLDHACAGLGEAIDAREAGEPEAACAAERNRKVA